VKEGEMDSELFLAAFGISQNPFNTMSLLLGAANIVLVIAYAVKLFVTENPEMIAKMENGINIILLLCFFMLFFVFVDPIYDMNRAFESIAKSGTNDPMVVVGGLIQTSLPFIIIGPIFSFNLICWFCLRMFQKRQLNYFTLDDKIKE
jgi:hypothetical protein